MPSSYGLYNPRPMSASPSKRVLTGLQPSGQLHLGNYAGAIQQLLKMQDDHAGNLFVFVASYHAMTSQQDGSQLRANIQQVVIDYLAFGLDPDKCTIYLQQHVPQVTELSWILCCLFPTSRLELGTSYKDKVDKGITPNAGLFTYPMLQAADILGVDADLVPVGKDQIQNVEFARDVAGRFNHAYGQDVFIEPQVMLRPGAEVLPGIDGQKMSKSYGNGIDPFLPEKKLRKLIMKTVSGSETMEEPKDPANDNVFALYKLLASQEQIEEMSANYLAGNYGYGHAKQALFELIVQKFEEPREKFDYYINHLNEVDEALAIGAEKAKKVADEVLKRVRKTVGY